MDATKLTAHSGCDGTADNSKEFLSYAAKLEVDCLEVDVRRFSNGLIVLAHDEGPVSALFTDALSEIRTHPEKKLNCDLKQRGMERAVWALACEYGVGDQIAFSGEVSPSVAAAEPDIFSHVEWYVNLELLFPEIRDPEFADRLTTLRAVGMADRLTLFLREYGARCVNAHYSIAGTPLYQELMRRDIPLSVWTPGDERWLCRFLDDCVYNITTRNARRACELAAGYAVAGGVR